MLFLWGQRLFSDQLCFLMHYKKIIPVLTQLQNLVSFQECEGFHIGTNGSGRSAGAQAQINEH